MEDEQLHITEKMLITAVKQVQLTNALLNKTVFLKVVNNAA